MKEVHMPLPPPEPVPLECLEGMDPNDIVSFLSNEHPQVIALVISLIEDVEHAMELLHAFPEETQVELTQRIAEMKPIPSGVIEIIDQILSQTINGTLHNNKVGGVDKLVQLFLSSDRSLDSPLLAKIEELDPELAQKIQERL